MKQIIWDLAATAGAENLSALQKDLDYKLEELRKNHDEYIVEAVPDERTIRRVINSDIQKITPEAVIAKLPRHVWYLREDYEAIKQLADDIQNPQEASPEKKATDVSQEDDPLRRHFAELSETALTLATNFESFLDMSDAILFDSKVGDTVYGGWLLPTEYREELWDRYRVKMHNIAKFLALDLLSHIREEFPELVKINDWAELTSNELTYDLVARLTRAAKKGAYLGKCNDCPS